jgi:hypothetical protein
VNYCTETDAHTLPRNEEILLNQGKFKICSAIHMKDGYHQVSLQKEDMHITFMSNPRGTKHWTVLAMGLKNAGAIFQRMMEWVLRGLPGVNIYIDDVFAGPTCNTPEELLVNLKRDLKAVMERLKEHDIDVLPTKAQLFVEEGEFCGL